MSTKHRSDQKRTAARPTYFSLGTDARGAVHIRCPSDGTVHVCLDGDRVERYRVAEDRIGEYMAAVANEYGAWLVEQYARADWPAGYLSVDE